MAFQVSPGVNVSEIDLTTVVPAVSTTTGAIAAHTVWGPVDQRVLVSSEDQLVSVFGKPNANTADDFFTAANFLAYGNALFVSRAISSNAVNASSNTAGVLIKNEDYYDESYSHAATAGEWIAKYPGILGNSLKVSSCGSANAWQQTYSTASGNTGTSNLSFGQEWNFTAGSKTVTIQHYASNTDNRSTVTTASAADFIAGDYLVSSNNITLGQIDSISSNASTGVVTITLKETYKAFTEGESSNFTIGRFGSSLTGNVVSVTTSNTTIIGLGTTFSSDFSVDDVLHVGGNNYKIATIANNTVMTFDASANTFAVAGGASANTTYYNLTTNTTNDRQVVKRLWEYQGLFDGAPTTTTYANTVNAQNDMIHVAVIDEDGDITGTKGAVIEKYENLSVASDAKGPQGESLYYKDVINRASSWIWWGQHATGAVNHGKSASATNDGTAGSGRIYTHADLPKTVSLGLGSDGGKDNAGVINALNMFKSAEDVDVSFILGSAGNTTTLVHAINNIAETRKDCIVVLSPERADVVNNNAYANKQVDDINEFRNTLPSTSYAVMDSGWKYQYDKYNDMYRYVPLNGDTAGLMVQTDLTRDPWYSPAGFNRGNVKNVIKLAWNPDKAARDELYKNGVNPVVTFPGQGTVLFGDKTMLAQPSAFDRINVRRLFIVLEKAISTASKFTLFEFNDEFTRSQFKNLVEPFLRDVQGRRGITDFRVVCDGTNNTGEVIDRNEFIGDIYIKPARSINFIQLNFVAVRTGVEFDEIVGRF